MRYLTQIELRVFLFLILFNGGFSPCGGFAAKTHAHGSGNVDIAIDSARRLIIELNISAESIFGFEHEAKSSQEKSAEIKALDILRSKDKPVILFDSALECVIKVLRVQIESEKNGHRDVKAIYSVSCHQDLSGKKIRFPFLASFPRLKKLNVQVLSDYRQYKVIVLNPDQQVEL